MLISIITVNLNNKSGLQKTLESAQTQWGGNFEHIVIDGNSTDGSKETISEFKGYLSNWTSEPDTGIYHAMNKGVRASNGDYLLFLNSGDTLNNSGVIAETLKFLKGRRDIYYGNLVLCKERKNVTLTFPKKLNFGYFFQQGFLPHPSTFFRRSLFEKTSYYNENLKIVSDWEFILCALFKHNATYKHMDFVVSNHMRDGISTNPENLPLLLKERKIVLEKNFPQFMNTYYRSIKFEDSLSSVNIGKMKQFLPGIVKRKLKSIWIHIFSARNFKGK